MLSKFAQILNKSVTSNKSNSPEKITPVEPCKLCHGAGCCYLCENNDDWGIMVYCSNKKENHIVHQACDNLTEDLFKCICHYYCPKCRQDGNYKVTFYKRVGENKRNEIRNLLKIIPRPVISAKNILNKPKLILGTVNQTLEESKKPKKPEKDKFTETPLINLEPESPEDISIIITEVMESLLRGVSPEETIITDESGSESSFNETSEEDDSFREMFPGQTKYELSNHNLSIKSMDQSKKSISIEGLSEDDSFSKIFPEQTCNNYTPSEEELLNVSLPNKTSKNLSKKPVTPDNSSTSSQTSLSCFDSQEKAKLIDLINVLTGKLRDEHEENTNLKNIIQGQEREISELQRENLKFELELEEAEAVIGKTGLDLGEIKEKYESLDKVYKELKFLNINPSEAYEHPPMEVFEFYKKESILSKKKSVQIKCLLEENKSYKKSVMELKNENEDLRGKVQNLIEEDIDKKILNFAIEENRRLELKIKIQRDRNINMGQEFKNQINRTYDLEQKNKSYKEKIANFEKITKDNSHLMAGNVENDWETISLNSEPEVNITHNSQKSSSPKSSSQNSQKSSSPKPNETLEALVKKALKQMLNDEKNPPKSDAKITNEKTDKTTPLNANSVNTQSSGVKTGNGNLQNRSICRFYLQNRCIFGYKCRNIHSKGPQQNYIPPWNPKIYPNGVFESPNHSSFNSRTNKQPNHTYSITGFGDGFRGKSVGYWSAPPIPIEQTRFSHLSEFNLDGNNFPTLH